MNFIFEWQNNILRTKYCFGHEKIKFISSSCRVMIFLLYRQKDIDNNNNNIFYLNTVGFKANIAYAAVKIINFYSPKSKTPTNFGGKLPKLRHR